jgi:hypothetical protein
MLHMNKWKWEVSSPSDFSRAFLLSDPAVVAGNRGPVASPLSGQPFIGMCGIHGIHQQLTCPRLIMFTISHEMANNLF